MRAALLAALVLAALPSAAAAAPPWSAPQDVSRPHLFVSDPSLVAAGDGSWLAAWRWQDGVRAAARTGESAGVRSRSAAAFGPEHATPAGRIGNPVAIGATRAALALLRPVGSTRAPRGELRVALGRASGRFGPSRVVARRPRIASPAFAGNAHGDLALAWFEDRGTRNDRVYVALRRAGRRFGRPLRLATGRVRSVTVAAGPRGDTLVAWDARGVVRARYRPPGRGFGRLETIRSQPTYFAALRAAITARGRAYLAWAAQFRSEGGDSGPAFVQAAVRPAGAHRFRRAELLERLGRDRELNPAGLAVDPGSGRAIVAWTGFDGATGRVRVAETDAGGRFSIRQDVSPAGVEAVLDDVAMSPAGSRVVLWTAFSPAVQQSQVQGAYARFGERFGPPEAISAREQADTARAAFEPQTDRLVAVWVNRPAGSSGPLASIRTYLQAAARSG
jgi:hypothetical protein